MKAALLRSIGEPLMVVDDMQTIAVGAGQVKIRVRAAGLCHSDLSAMTGRIKAPIPLVPGHEGAGEVLEVGPGVDSVVAGDHIVVNFVPACGLCGHCLRGEGNLCMEIVPSIASTPSFRLDGEPVYGMTGCGTFTEELVLPQQAVVKIDDDVPFDIAALIGCSVTTGTGAVFNTAKVEAGSTVAIIGCGGVGISAMMAAKLARASVITGIDPNPMKREVVLNYGATAAVSPEEASESGAHLTDGMGFDFVFEVVGHSSTVKQAYQLARRGGTVVVVGLGTRGDNLELPMSSLAPNGRTVVGSGYGGKEVPSQMHNLINLWRQSALDLSSLVTHRIGLDDINRGFDLMKVGDGIRTVIDM